VQTRRLVVKWVLAMVAVWGVMVALMLAITATWG
jgi:hypothetical protein